MIKNIAQQLRDLVDAVEPQLQRMDPNAMRIKPDTSQWSKKEILGHLIDSAANNHQRFVRAVSNGAAQFPTYDQEAWVTIQKHNQRPWPSLVALWHAYNHHLVHVIECIPEHAEGFACNIGTADPVPLNRVVEDYLSHLQGHLEDVLDDHP